MSDRTRSRIGSVGDLGPRQRMLLGVACILVIIGVVGIARARSLSGTHRPTQAQASQIIKYSGFTVNCVDIYVDDASPRWAYVTPAKGAGGCGPGFKGLAVVYENAPRNVNTVGIAWKPVYQGKVAQCPLPKVPAAVAHTFGLCK